MSCNLTTLKTLHIILSVYCTVVSILPMLTWITLKRQGPMEIILYRYITGITLLIIGATTIISTFVGLWCTSRGKPKGIFVYAALSTLLWILQGMVITIVSNGATSVDVYVEDYDLVMQTPNSPTKAIEISNGTEEFSFQGQMYFEYKKCCGDYYYDDHKRIWPNWPNSEMPSFCCNLPARSCDSEGEKPPTRTTEDYKTDCYYMIADFISQDFFCMNMFKYFLIIPQAIKTIIIIIYGRKLKKDSSITKLQVQPEEVLTN